MNNVILIGYAAVGKTTVGRLLAEKLNRQFFDTDIEAERRLGMTVQNIFHCFGEEHFRKVENDILAEWKNLADCVIACGGGSVCLPQFETFAEGGTVVWLKATAQTVASRLDGTRPLADGKSPQALADHILLRQKFYSKYADISLDTDLRTPRQVADMILNLL